MVEDNQCLQCPERMYIEANAYTPEVDACQSDRLCLLWRKNRIRSQLWNLSFGMCVVSNAL